MKKYIAFLLLVSLFVGCSKPEVVPAKEESDRNFSCPDGYEVFYDGKGDVEDKSKYKCRLKK